MFLSAMFLKVVACTTVVQGKLGKTEKKNRSPMWLRFAVYVFSCFGVADGQPLAPLLSRRASVHALLSSLPSRFLALSLVALWVLILKFLAR